MTEITVIRDSLIRDSLNRDSFVRDVDLAFWPDHWDIITMKTFGGGPRRGLLFYTMNRLEITATWMNLITITLGDPKARFPSRPTPLRCVLLKTSDDS
jgi:hypothetical protein